VKRHAVVWVVTAVVIAALVGAFAVACGIDVTEPEPTSPAPVRPATPAASPSPAPEASASTTPAPLVTPTAAPPAPSPTTPAQTDAARRAATTVSVKAVLPEFAEQAQELFLRSGVPGAAVAVVAGDAAVYVNCFGVREAGKPEKVDKDTVFQLASVSKGFTATMLAALVSGGELGWDDPVHTYWRGFELWDPWVSDHVTIRDLMSQRSGLPEYAGDELEQFAYGRLDVLRRLRHLQPAAGFRSAYAYQNSLPTAAAVTAAKATGESWEELVRTRVIEPLRMDSTALTYREYLEAPDRSACHVLVSGKMQAQTPDDDDLFAPAGGVSSTIADMVPYLRMQLNGGALAGVRVAAADDLAATHLPVTVSGADQYGPTAYGMGWKTFGYLGRRVVEHAGDFSAGVSTVASMVPDDGVGVVVLTNAFPEGHALATALVRTLYDLYLEGAPQKDWLAEQQAAIAGALKGSILDPYRHLPDTPPLDAAPARAKAAYTGLFANDYYGRIRVSRAAGAGLDVKLGRGDVLRYVPWDGDTWREPGTDTAAVFTVRDGRAVSVRLMVLDFGGRPGRFARQ
jgi:CubicO group peptidase (beta-lactamase class C family)